MNDYELIYLFRRNLDSEIIFKTLSKKYEPLIYKTLISFFGNKKDNYYNEALYILFISLIDFDENKNKTFVRYFQLRLKWHFIKVIKDESKYKLCEESTWDILEEEPQKPYISTNTLSNFEYTIYDEYYQQKNRVSDICKRYNKTSKQIYNTLYRIREKLKIENS